MSLAVWESHSALTPRKLLVRCRCKTQGRSGGPIGNPSFCISGAPGFTLLSPEGLVNLVKARNVERMEEQFFFLFVLASCACVYEFTDYWTSDLIELEIIGENLRTQHVTRENPEQGTNKPTLVPFAVNFFPLLFASPRLGEGSPRGCPRISAHPGSVVSG